jgi:preprotein translocase subunit SecA
MFRSLESSLRAELIAFIENLDGFFASQQAQQQTQNNFVHVIPEVEGGNSNQIPGNKNVDGEKIGRNDPCPCGSGKKVKKCDCKEFESLRS